MLASQNTYTTTHQHVDLLACQHINVLTWRRVNSRVYIVLENLSQHSDTFAVMKFESKHVSRSLCSPDHQTVTSLLYERRLEPNEKLMSRSQPLLQSSFPEMRFLRNPLFPLFPQNSKTEKRNQPGPNNSYGFSQVALTIFHTGYVSLTCWDEDKPAAKSLQNCHLVAAE